MCLGAAELAQQLIALDVLPADESSIPSTYMAAITVCNSIFRVSDTLVWLVCALHTQTHMQKKIYEYKIITFLKMCIHPTLHISCSCDWG